VDDLGISKSRKKVRAEGSGPNRFRPRRFGLVWLGFAWKNWVQEINVSRCRFRYSVYVYRRLVVEFKSYQEIKRF